MMKRASDDQISNGNVMETDPNSDVKKAKMDGSKPSRVLHVRGVPADATEAEVIHLGLPFGRMTNLVMARKKNQALLEMADVATAQAMVTYYTERPPSIRGHNAYVQFSNHEQLKTENNMSIQAALQAADQMLEGMEGGGSHTVLRVVIDNMMYPITVDILKQIFSKYGQVMKIVTFNKNNNFQALIQYSDAIAAQSGKASLNGQNIYNGCCTLRIDISKLQELNVKFNNDKTWDYTNPNLPSGDQPPIDNSGDGILGSFGGPGPMFGNFGGGTGGGMAPGNYGMPRMPGMGGMGMGGMGGGMGGMGPGMGGNMGMGMGMGMGQMGTGMSDMRMGQGMGQGMRGMGMGGSGMGGGGGVAGGMGGSSGGGMGMRGMGAEGMGMSGGMGPGMAMGGGMGNMGGGPPPMGGCVLIVSNLAETKVSPDAIFTLFGVYGIVLRVKILFNKKDTALVQFADPVQAQNAMTSLDRANWNGKSLKVSMSKHASVQLLNDNLPDAWMTKDFANSPAHRSKYPNSKSYNNIYPPTPTLHLSNISESVSADDLTDMFSQFGNVVAFKFFEHNTRMALVQMENQQHAIAALVGLHNHHFEGSSYLRVSFTKSVI